MKLTDNEIRDITKHLEAGKDLPDKYRFLLFEDKREVELVWNGKTSDVCNVVLPWASFLPLAFAGEAGSAPSPP